jgi:WD40 repeat protein
MTPPDAAAAPAMAKMTSPYVGLQPFLPEHARFFFGREREQRLVIANLLAQPLTVLYGASGVGKSSLLNAGVLPQLRRDRPTTPVIVFREWARADYRSELVRRCIDAVWATPRDQPRPAEHLPLDVVLRAAAVAARETVLVLFDQFEEYFVYHPKSASPESFEAEFARAVNRDDVDVGVLLSLREDGLAKLDRFQERIPDLLSNRLRLKHLDASGAETAIRRPLAVWNEAPPDGGPPVTLDDQLVNLVIGQIRTGRVSVTRQSGSGAEQKDESLIEAPFLQLVMLRLWLEERARGSTALRAATLTGLGGAAAIVGRHLDEAMDRLDSASQAVAAGIFDRLVTPTGGKIACSLSALAGWAGEALAPDVPRVVGQLCNERILRATDATDERETDSYEVFHDVLAPAILDWRARWLAAREQETAVAHAQAETAAAAERQRQEMALTAEREQARIKRRALARLLLASGVLTLIAIAGWGWSFYQGLLAGANEKAARALLAVSRDDPVRALDLGLAAIDKTWAWQLPPTAAAVDAVRQGLRILPNREQVERVADEVWHVAVSPDGQTVATGGKDKRVTLWRLADGRLQPTGETLNLPASIREIAFTPAGDRLLTVAGDELRVFDRSQPAAPPRVFHHGSPIFHAFALSADGRRAATAGWTDGQAAVIRLWDLEGEGSEPIGEIDLQGAWVMNLAFSPDGCCLATAAVIAGGIGRTYTEIWGIDSRRKLLAVPNPAESDAILFSRDGEALIVAGRDNRARIIRPAAGRLPQILAERAGGLHAAAVDTLGATPLPLAEPPAVPWESLVLAGHADRLRDLALNPDGDRLATAGGDGWVRVWGLAGGQTLFTLGTHAGYVEAVAFTPDGRYLVSGGRDKTVRLWDVSRHAGAVNAIAFTPAGDRVATAGSDGTAKLWDVTGDVPILTRTLVDHQREIYRLAMDPRGDILATAGFDRSVRLWRLADGAPLAATLAHADQLRAAAFDPTGRWFATAAADGVIHLYDLDGWRAGDMTTALPAPQSVKHDLERATTQVHALALGAGLWASGGSDGLIRLWTWQGEPRGRLARKGVNIIRDLAFSPGDGELAALGTRQVTLWPAATLTASQPQPRLVLDLGRNCSSVGFSADGRQIAVACWDGSVSVFDSVSGVLRETLTPHSDRVNDAAFSPDGSQVATASSDGTFLVAPLDSRRLYSLARRLHPQPAPSPRP